MEYQFAILWSVGEQVASFVTSCQRVWVPRWKQMPKQLIRVASASVVASAAVEPERQKKPMPVACRVVSEIRVTKVKVLHLPFVRCSKTNSLKPQGRSNLNGDILSYADAWLHTEPTDLFSVRPFTTSSRWRQK